jgi:putative colanic acid biosynthesis glycosyltransferase
MPTLFQINECINLSTGKISQQIGEAAMKHGWDSWLTYSAREAVVPSKSKLIEVGTYFDTCLHYVNQRLFDNEGLSSKKCTRKLIAKIDIIRPDIIQLHNIHDHWLNYQLLFDYLATLDIPIIWVQHDCWAFTGGCMYFDMLNCNKWKDGCKDCPDKRTILNNQSARNFNLKKEHLDKIKNLTFVTVSEWLADLLRDSAQKDRPILTIHNGTDIKVFKPLEFPIANGGTYRILGVAAVWDARKGLNDFVKLRGMLPAEYEITLVGLTEKQIKTLPQGITGIDRISNVQELAKLYAEFDVFVNPTYSDNFPTTNIEALACGTPVITYKTGGSPEAVDWKAGLVVKQGDVGGLANSIMWLRENPKSQQDCRQRALALFDKDKCFEQYIDLFNKLLSKKA